MAGTLTVALNPPDGQRGYVGIELTRAPVAPGLYYLVVRSVGSTPYRIRPAAHLTQRALPEHEREGSFAFFVPEEPDTYSEGTLSYSIAIAPAGKERKLGQGLRR